MEHEETTFHKSGHSPGAFQCFQSDKFVKKNNVLKIPDTIPEQNSVESGLNGGNSKMEASNLLLGSFVRNSNQNISFNGSDISNESSNASTIITIDHSFLKNCERKLLECSNSEDERNSLTGNCNIKAVSRKLGFMNDTISTPPNELKHQINMLRDEIEETCEFHDNEIQILKEENSSNCTDSENYINLFEKYSTLMEMYTALKNEYDEYQNEQEKTKLELEKKTAACFENLCSQIEASDSSLNFSSASIFSLNTEIKSSTMVGDVSEVETTVVNDATLLVHDPLAISIDTIFKTPSQTPLRSMRKLCPQKLSSTKRSAFKELQKVKDFNSPQENLINFSMDEKNKFMNLETALYDKMKEIEDLENRLLKVEDLSTGLKNENERVISVYKKENTLLKETLSKKEQQLGELTQKLKNETLGLNPSLKDSLINIPETKILSIFIETIMESCKKIQDELTKKFTDEKLQWEEQKNNNITLTESLRSQVKCLNEELNALKNFERPNSCYEKIEIENQDLKERVLKSEEVMSNLKAEIDKAKKEQEENDLKVTEVMREIDLLKKDDIFLSFTLNSLEKNENLGSDVLNTPNPDEIVVPAQKEVNKFINKLEAIKDEFYKFKKQKNDFAEILNTLEENKKNLLNIFYDIHNTSETPNDRVSKIIKTSMEARSDSSDTVCTKILRVFMDSIGEICKNVQNELLNKFGNEKMEWEAEKKNDLLVIDDLENEIKALSDKNEAVITEFNIAKDELVASCDALKIKLLESEAIISSKNEEIHILQSQESSLRQLTKNLEQADELIHSMRGQLSTAEFEKLEIQKRCEELERSAKSLQGEIDYREGLLKGLEQFESVERNENPVFKQRVTQPAEIIENLKEELANNKLKVETLEKEVDQFKKEENNLLTILHLLYSIYCTLEEFRKNLDNILHNEESNSDTTSERASKIIKITIGAKENSVETLGTKIFSVFMEIISEACKSIQDELTDESGNEKVDWEIEKKNDILKIDELENQIQVLNEKKSAQETKINEVNIESNNLVESYDILRNKLSEAENVISSKDEENRFFQSQEVTLRQVQESLADANELINGLKSQLFEAETEKMAMKKRCEELEGNVTSLQAEIDSKGAVLHGLEQSKSLFEKTEIENSDLKQQIIRTEEIVVNLKQELKTFVEELTKHELKVDELKTITDTYKKEENNIREIVDRLKESKKNTQNVLSEIETECDTFSDKISTAIKTIIKPYMKNDVTETFGTKILNIFVDIITENCKNVHNELINKFKNEKMEWETEKKNVLFVIDDLENQIKTLSEKNNAQENRLHETLTENKNLASSFDTLKSRMQEAETMISSKNEEIYHLQTQKTTLNQVRESLAHANILINGLKSQLSDAQIENTEVRKRCQQLEENITHLKSEVDFKEAILHDFEKSKYLYQKTENENLQLKEQIARTEENIVNLKHELMHSHREVDVLKNKMAEAENMISSKNQEILFLQSQDTELEQVRENLAKANELINRLKSQLSEAEVEKTEVEKRYQELEENTTALKADIDAKKAVLYVLEQSKFLFQKTEIENADLKEHIVRTEENIVNIKEELQNSNEEINVLKRKISEAETVINSKDEEIRLLQSQETSLLQVRENLSEADELIHYLKLQLESAETEKTELHKQCQKLQEKTSHLQREIDSKENILHDLNQLKTSFEEIENENLNLKEQIAQTEENIRSLKQELKISMGKLSKNEYKVEELEAIIENYKKEENNILEIVKTLEDCKENVQNALNAFETGCDKDISNTLLPGKTPSDKVHDVMKTIMQSNKNKEATDTLGTKILQIFMNSIIDSCKSVQNELVNKFENEKMDWETEKKNDLVVIDDLENQIKVLNEKNSAQEDKLMEINTEKEYLASSYDALKSKMSEAENIIYAKDEEIRLLQSQETSLLQVRDNLTEAEELIRNLKSQLASAESKKTQLHIQCEELEEKVAKLQDEINSKEGILLDFEQLKFSFGKTESENSDLKQQMVHMEEVLVRMKEQLKLCKQELEQKELQAEEFENQIDSLKKEKNAVTDYSDKLKILEENRSNLIDILSDIQHCLEMPSDTVTKLLSTNFANRKIFNEKINKLLKVQMNELKAENKNLRFGNDNLKEKVVELNKIISQFESDQPKEEIATTNRSSTSTNLRRKSTDLSTRRLDKLEEINHNLTELVTSVLTVTQFPDLEKIKFFSVRNFPSVNKQVTGHIKSLLESKEKELSDLKTVNNELDDECESYATMIKDLKKEAAVAWKTNMERTKALELEILKLKDTLIAVENEKQDLLRKITKLENDVQKLKTTSTIEGCGHDCSCVNEGKKVTDLKRLILLKEQKILELQDLEVQSNSYKSQIKYLEYALDQEKKKCGEEKEKNKKLQNEVNELTKNLKIDTKKPKDAEMLDELRMCGTLSGGVVQNFVEKEKMRKLTKDIAILKELCRARHVEIKRLEAEISNLRGSTQKNSNQLNSPIRTRAYTRYKTVVKDISSPWKTDVSGKENRI